jgi:hypothetical protein
VLARNLLLAEELLAPARDLLLASFIHHAPDFAKLGLCGAPDLDQCLNLGLGLLLTNHTDLNWIRRFAITLPWGWCVLWMAVTNLILRYELRSEELIGVVRFQALQ